MSRFWLALRAAVLVPIMWPSPKGRRLLQRWLSLAMQDICGYHHVDVEIGQSVWLWSSTSGGHIRPARWPFSTKPSLSVPAIVPHLGIPRDAWLSRRPRRLILATLYTCGLLPRLHGVETCSTMTSRLLGLPIQRTPAGVLRALRSRSEIADDGRSCHDRHHYRRRRNRWHRSRRQ